MISNETSKAVIIWSRSAAAAAAAVTLHEVPHKNSVRHRTFSQREDKEVHIHTLQQKRKNGK